MDDVFDGVGTCILPSWHCFGRFVSETLGSYVTYIYRGQRKASWNLRPKIDRSPEGPLKPEQVREHLQRFKMACRGRRTGSRPSREDEWWALAQHYGLATPLLDWTTSPFVAAYFAFETPDLAGEPRAVFALSKKAVERRGSEVYVVNPQSDNNPRLISQGGLFTRTPPETDLWDYMQRRVAEWGPVVLLKITIPEHCRVCCLRDLNRMNINHLSLFPDLTGASEYCNMALSVSNYAQ